MATGPIETHLHHSFNWENGAPGAREGPRGRSVNCGSVPSAQCVRLRPEINPRAAWERSRPRMQARERAPKPRDALSARGDAPRGRRRGRRPPPRRPRGISDPAVRRLSPPQRGPPSAQRPSRRRRAHYRVQPRPRPPGDFKTMPVYGARPGSPEHAAIGKIKTAGRRLAHSVKCRVWTAGPGPAP